MSFLDYVRTLKIGAADRPYVAGGSRRGLRSGPASLVAPYLPLLINGILLLLEPNSFVFFFPYSYFPSQFHAFLICLS
jgi:hypothetical protein